jgi:hypothetical protein
MSKSRFRPGQRVRTRVATSFALCGAQGYVLSAWPTIPNAYDVRVAGQSDLWLMWGDELAHVEMDVAEDPRRSCLGLLCWSV